MPKTVSPLARKFATILRNAEPTPEELDTITGKNVPQRVLLPHELKNALSQLVAKLHGMRAENSEEAANFLKAAWQKVMAKAIEHSDGLLVFVGYDLEPLLDAVHKVFLYMQKVKATDSDVDSVAQIYTQLSQLKAPPSTATKAPAKAISTIPYSFDVKQAQLRLNDLGYTPALDPDGKLGRLTKAALKWFREKNSSYISLDDEATIVAVLAGQKTEEDATAGITHEAPSSDPAAPPTWGVGASRLADTFDKIIKKASR
jgi:hypothetical protein